MCNDEYMLYFLNTFYLSLLFLCRKADAFRASFNFNNYRKELVLCLVNLYHLKTMEIGDFQEVPIFKGYDGIGIQSRYSGDLKVQPQGNMEVWLDMVRNHVIGTPLEVILAMGLSATMIDFIHRDFPVENLLVSLTGTSTTGKSTGLMFAVSMGAIPSFAENSFMLSFLDTELSLIHRMPSGYPVGIDEVSLLQKNSTKLLYSLGNGKERGRMRKDITMREAKEFHTAIFMSGEQSILQMADSTAGLRVRVMEFYNVVWTKSAESADCIKRICQSNYGWIVPLFAEFLLKQDKASLIQSCEKWSDEFLAEREGSSDDVLMARMSKKVGVILATAELAEQVIGVRIDVEYVKDFLLQHLMTDPEESDIGLKAYGEIISFMVEHPQEFGQAMNTPPEFKIEYFKMGRIVKGETVTLYDGRISNSILYISKEAFTHILEKASFKDIRIILKRLKELDLLVSEKDRYISKFKLGVEDVMIKGYRIRIPNGIQEEEDKDIESDKLILDDEIEWEEL